MSIVVFGVGVVVFFLTVYGTVVAGGLQLTKVQLDTSPALAPDLATGRGDSKNALTTLDVIESEF